MSQDQGEADSSMQAPTSDARRLDRLLSFIELDAGNLPLRKAAIREACDIGEWEIARGLIDTGLQSHPSEPGLLGLAGYSYLQQQRYPDAQDALTGALAQGLDTPELHYNLAFALFMQGGYADALGHLTAPLLPLEVPLALQLRARCLHHLGRREDASNDCKSHLEIAPENAETHGLLALLLYEQDQHEQAAEHARIALQRNPRQLDAMLAQASLQAARHDYDVARQSYDVLVQAHPQCGRGWLGLALIDLNHFNMDAAKQDIEHAARHLPDHIGTWHVLAWISLMTGNVAEADRAFQHALGIDRTFGETHGGLAVIAAMQGREADAEQSIKRALRLDPNAMSPRYAQMLLLQAEGRHEEARAILEAVLARPLPDSDMRYRDLIASHELYLRSRAPQAPGSTLH